MDAHYKEFNRMYIKNFNHQSAFHTKSFIDSALKVIGIILIANGFFSIQFFLLFQNQLKFYDNLISMNKNHHQYVINLLEKNKLLIDQSSYQTAIEEKNKRTKLFLWLKQWCDEWLCLDPANSQWSKLSLQYDPTQQSATVAWTMDFNDSSQVHEFSNWLDQSRLLTHLGIESIEPNQSIWKVQYAGEKII
jgi:hypothetical protein